MIRDRNEWEYSVAIYTVAILLLQFQTKHLYMFICYYRTHLLRQNQTPKRTFKGCLHGAIATAIYVSEVEACVRFNIYKCSHGAISTKTLNAIQFLHSLYALTLPSTENVYPSCISEILQCTDQ